MEELTGPALDLDKADICMKILIHQRIYSHYRLYWHVKCYKKGSNI